MKEIGSYEAKTHLPQLLESVVSGESFVITRRGEPIALLAPIQQHELTPQEAAQHIRELRKGISWEDQGSTSKAMKEGRR